MPMIASSSIGNGLTSPRPPWRGRRRRRASTSCPQRAQARAPSAAPSASPDSSAGDQIDRERSPRAAHRSSRRGLRRTHRRRKSSRCRRPRSTVAGSATIALPAATASPASPARATSSIVRGPIAGRSKRRSWPGFGALTRTPTPGGVARGPAAQFGDAREHLVGAFRGFDRQHVIVGDDRGLADVERAERGDQRQARRRCRRDRAPMADSGRAARRARGFPAPPL